MVNLYSWNVNGIRACQKDERFTNWIKAAKADVVGLQEVRAQEDQIPNEVKDLGLHSYWYPAEKKGYSGVGILSREAAREVHFGIGNKDFDSEGRVITAEFKGFFFVSAYFPNSQDAGRRIDYKIKFCKAILKWVDGLRDQRKPVVLCGDYNIAHQAIDLARPDSNEKSPGYLPEERAWMGSFLESGWVDTFRYLYPDKKDAYSWWSLRTRARERNVGWRIDYHAVHEKDRKRIREAAIHPTVLGSDHCPVSLKFDAEI